MDEEQLKSDITGHETVGTVEKNGKCYTRHLFYTNNESIMLCVDIPKEGKDAKKKKWRKPQHITLWIYIVALWITLMMCKVQWREIQSQLHARQQRIELHLQELEVHLQKLENRIRELEEHLQEQTQQEKKEELRPNKKPSLSL